MTDFQWVAESAPLPGFVIRATVVLATGIALAWLMRKRSAQVRHCLWTVTLLLLLLLPALTLWAPQWEMPLLPVATRPAAEAEAMGLPDASPRSLRRHRRPGPPPRRLRVPRSRSWRRNLQIWRRRPRSCRRAMSWRNRPQDRTRSPSKHETRSSNTAQSRRGDTLRSPPPGVAKGPSLLQVHARSYCCYGRSDAWAASCLLLPDTSASAPWFAGRIRSRTPSGSVTWEPSDLGWASVEMYGYS